MARTYNLETLVGGGWLVGVRGVSAAEALRHARPFATEGTHEQPRKIVRDDGMLMWRNTAAERLDAGDLPLADRAEDVPLAAALCGDRETVTSDPNFAEVEPAKEPEPLFYRLEEWYGQPGSYERRGKWVEVFSAAGLGTLTEYMSRRDRRDRRERHIVASPSGRVVVLNAAAATAAVVIGRDLLNKIDPPQTPSSVPSTADAEPFHIVMALDRDGPCERGETPYAQHILVETAKAEARRLAKQHGGRFAVLSTAFVVGWVERELAPKEIPF